STQSQFAFALYENLKAQGVDVLLDERDERFGAKMKDFELLGFHCALIVGKALAEQKVELVLREGLQKIELDAQDSAKLVGRLLGILGGENVS
ncbi:His/Gly/Thr/Pro-type tRNA ligase C-terminal domain-containing protein, partial [uncultured Helicobacter sp.]